MTRKQKTLALAIAAAVVLTLVVLSIVVVRQRVRRHRVFRPAGGEVAAKPPRGIPPVEQWSQTFQQLDGEELAGLLAQIEQKHPELYRQWSLGYLHARALVESGNNDEAGKRLAPFLEKGHPFRDRALYHHASIHEGAEASRDRNALIFEFPDSAYRDEAIDDELEYLGTLGDPRPLVAFGVKIAPSASTERRREISARIVEALAAQGQLDAAFTRGMALLNGNNGDDAADRVSRALDRPEITRRLTDAQLELFGDTFQHHRHFDRAIAYLQLAIRRAQPPAKTAESSTNVQTAAMVAAKKKNRPKRAPAKKKVAAKKNAAPAKPAPPANPRRRLDELEFALGRSYFGAEKYADAQNIYLRGARATPDAAQKCTFLWHAARSAQLQGDDKTAEQLMTAAIAVKGQFPATLAAVTQRLRTRIRQRRFADAMADYTQLKRMAGNERAFLEGSLAMATGTLAMGNARFAQGALAAIPRALQDDYDEAEIAYWSARALESIDPPASFRAYLQVLRSTAPSHFAYLARTRLDSPALGTKLTSELAVREAEVKKLMAAGKWDLARRVQTDRILLSSRDRANQLKILSSIYRNIPQYAGILALRPAPLPRFPLENPKPDDLLLAMGLFDEALPAIESRYALRPASQALSRSYALNLGGSSKASIYAIEVMMKSVPADYHPDLLPATVRQLLYPRYFYSTIAADAKRYGTDPTLVLSIMREESRFNPRAKSQAAARGLLQFIITTARDIGRDVGLVDVDPEDLYDPSVIIRLGAKYISELASQFGGNRYRVAAAYNAGPKQVALWNRMQPAPGDDYFLTAVNFDETKHYVRKVMNSYERYSEIYGKGAPAGGLRAEP